MHWMVQLKVIKTADFCVTSISPPFKKLQMHLKSSDISSFIPLLSAGAITVLNWKIINLCIYLYVAMYASINNTWYCLIHLKASCKGYHTSTSSNNSFFFTYHCSWDLVLLMMHVTRACFHCCIILRHNLFLLCPTTGRLGRFPHFIILYLLPWIVLSAGPHGRVSLQPPGDRIAGLKDICISSLTR